jgi:hypothetical protein
MAEAGEAGGEGARGADAARSYFSFVIRSPATGGQVCAGEVNGGGKVFKTFGMRDRQSGRWIPLELIRLDGGRAYELENREVTRDEDLPESRA